MSLRVILLFIGMADAGVFRPVFCEEKHFAVAPPESPGTSVAPDPFAGSDIVAYQVGAFLVRADADRAAAALALKDIVGEIHSIRLRGKAYWVVTVTVSGIPFENLPAELLDAGFPSIPIRKSDHPLADLLMKEREAGQ
ncbi:MAG TPA: hypothetical protein VMC79_08700 [Rectinemataceae bacterium]|nr:hypothetical protein [Rectinemataceae bacterium]